jgi:hypothetical protein
MYTNEPNVSMRAERTDLTLAAAGWGRDRLKSWQAFSVLRKWMSGSSDV